MGISPDRRKSLPQPHGRESTGRTAPAGIFERLWIGSFADS
jgi:hypothetical protein